MIHFPTVFSFFTRHSRFSFCLQRKRTSLVNIASSVKWSITMLFRRQKIVIFNAPVDVKILLLCLAWYTTSIISNTLNKKILTEMSVPVFLSMNQFLLTSVFGMIFMAIGHRITDDLPPGLVSEEGLIISKDIFYTTLPMGFFQLFGHIFSHKATSLIPVSFVHTIKALSPLLTIMIYRTVFNRNYSRQTYIALIPLVSGVVLTCIREIESNLNGIFFAFISCLTFVLQNIYSKKILTYNSPDEDEKTKPQNYDKLNILVYCSSLAFVFTFPIWVFHEDKTPISSMTLKLCLFIAFNGFSHFSQNLIAFQILGLINPISYSIASLIKRVFVILFSILYFRQNISSIQFFGILLTFYGLYLYDRTKHKDLILPK